MAKKKKEYTLIPRIHDRKIDREIARRRMKEKGMRRICSHGYNRTAYQARLTSYFANHWREYAY